MSLIYCFIAEGDPPPRDAYLNRRVDKDMVRKAVARKLPGASRAAVIIVKSKDWNAPPFDRNQADYDAMYARIRSYLLSHERLKPDEADAGIAASAEHWLNYFIPATNKLAVAVPFD